MKILLSILLFSFFLYQPVAAQTILRLEKQFADAKTDTARISLLNEIADNFCDNYQYDSCKKYATISLHLVNTLFATNSSEQNTAYILRLKKLKADALETLGSALTDENVNAATDSLQAAVKYWKETGDKQGLADAYQRLGQLYTNQNNFTTALQYFNAGLTLYIQAADKPDIAAIYYFIALVQRYMTNYGDALENNIKSLSVAKELKDSTLIIQCLLANGFIYLLVKEFNEALKNQLEALRIATLQKDSGYIATAYSDMGVTNMYSGNAEAALKYHYAALNIRKRLNIDNNISSSYAYIAQILAGQKKYPQALAANLEALQYAKRLGFKQYILDVYYNIANDYYSLHDYENALKNFDTLLQVSIQFKDSYRHALALEGSADIYFEQGKTTQAISALQKAITIADTTDYRNLKNIYKRLSSAYAKNNNYKNAYLSSLKFKQFSDSAASQEKASKITSLSSQLEFENKRALLKASQDKQLAVQQAQIRRQKLVRNITIVGLVIVVALAILFFIRFKEKKKLNNALEQTLTDLKSTQSQLIQSEKMASLGELTAGIAHEIQNPLNFVNNFSEVNREMLVEMKEELATGNTQQAIEIANDIEANEEKINHHGKRADAIVKNMLQHSRQTKSVKEPTDINALCDEYLRLSYHGLRAKDKEFNADYKTDFDETIGKINIVSQDIGRVLLNLYNNAFYTVNEKRKAEGEEFKALVSVHTKKLNNKIEIKVSDNGNGIPDSIKEKIFQPFFTTKPTGSGTGLGLSLSYDIIKAHGGEIRTESMEGEGSKFIISLPLNLN